ncbi:MAG TPA: hypothetical protein VK485_08730 [Sphingomicrobium sp.]|nr:hypothetical protein [Sphingomicrobium sp.]
MLMIRLAAASIAALALANPGYAQDTIFLQPGQSAQFKLGPTERPIETLRGDAEWTAFDVERARHLSGLTPPEKPVDHATPIYTKDGDVAPPPIQKEIVSTRFFSIAGQHSMLVVENGYEWALSYRAHMTLGGKSQLTDVCIVPPGKLSFEHWPHTIEKIELFDFRFVAWHPESPIPCA